LLSRTASQPVWVVGYGCGLQLWIRELGLGVGGWELGLWGLGVVFLCYFRFPRIMSLPLLKCGLKLGYARTVRVKVVLNVKVRERKKVRVRVTFTPLRPFYRAQYPHRS